MSCSSKPGLALVLLPAWALNSDPAQLCSCMYLKVFICTNCSRAQLVFLGDKHPKGTMAQACSWCDEPGATWMLPWGGGVESTLCREAGNRGPGESRDQQCWWLEGQVESPAQNTLPTPPARLCWHHTATWASRAGGGLLLQCPSQGIQEEESCHRAALWGFCSLGGGQNSTSSGTAIRGVALPSEGWHSPRVTVLQAVH